MHGDDKTPCVASSEPAGVAVLAQIDALCDVAQWLTTSIRWSCSEKQNFQDRVKRLSSYVHRLMKREGQKRELTEESRTKTQEPTCHVPSARRPFVIGMVKLAPKRLALTWPVMSSGPSST